jgi:hypothetical protein
MMPRQHELHHSRLSARKRRDQVIAPDVGVNYIDIVLFDDLGDRAGRLQIERIAERHFVPGGYHSRERLSQGAVGPDGEIHGVATFRETSNQSGYVDLPPTHLTRGTHLQDFHNGQRDTRGRSAALI